MAWTKEQELAINNKGTNIIVSAGAGSGKTAVLTARTMRILNEGTHINELLILTFTKAAAAEMKERIRKSIKKELINNPVLKDELNLIDQAYITTFDSFALSIVKKYHYLLNISNKIEISDASIIEMQKIKILDEIFDNHYAKPTPKFTKLIYDFCVKDDSSLKKNIISIANKIDSLTNRDEYLDSYISKFASSSFIDNCICEYKEIIKDNINELTNAYENLLSLTDGDYNAKLSESLMPLLNYTSLDELYFKIPLIKLPNLPRGSEEEVKKSKDQLKEILDNIKDVVFTYGTESMLKESLAKTNDYIEIIITIIKQYLESLHRYKEDNELYDFQDIAMLSIRVLKENEFVREELRDTFKEIMIDEYQDTNDIQEYFISMIENNNVYMVGDVKQSIYRFRNANPYIFKNKYDKYSQGIDGLKIDLVKNFRSRKEVLSNINEIFNLIMDNVIGGAEYHESHQMVFGNNSYIEEGLTNNNYNMEILEYELPEDKQYSKEEIEIFTIAKDIKDKISSKYQVFDKDEKLLRNIEYKDFVILMDRTTDFDLYKKIFEYLGIPLTLYKDSVLNNSDDIYILKNIIDIIIKIANKEFDTKFKYDFISIARSYLFALNDNEIFEIFSQNKFIDNIVFKTFEPLSKEIFNTNVPTLLEHIISTTNMYEKMISVGDVSSSIERISKLLDIANNLSNLGYDIFTFNNYINDLLENNYEMKYSVSTSSSNSVKIMTIHKSKGLEYHICYYSGLYKSFNISDLKERFLYDNKYGVITPYFDEGIKETITKYLVKYRYIEEEISEKIRLFYVALTRAKEKMILLTPCCEEEHFNTNSNNTIDNGIRRKYRSFSLIMNSIKEKIINYYTKIDLSAINLNKDYLYNNKTLEKIELPSLESIIVNEINVETGSTINEKHFSKSNIGLISKEVSANIELGLMMHEVLENIDFICPNYDLIENDFIANKIKKFLNNDLLKNVKDANIYKEYEFIYNDSNDEYHGIIDLILEYDDHIDIIDYKLSNVKDDNYINQLNGYKDYLSTISNKKINIYLYSILNEEFEEL